MLIALAGLAYVAAGLQTRTPFVATSRSSAPPARSVELQVEGVVDALAQAKQRGQPQAVSLSFTDRDLTAAAARYFPLGYAGITFSDPVVTLQPGQILLTGHATLGPIPSSFGVVGNVSVVGGKPVAHVVSASVGSVAVPDAARSAIEQDLQGAVASLLPANLQLTSITVASGSLAVNGVATP